nr:MAG TPA: hypothetical protein [Caudoviricetes sp.]
MIWQNYRYIRIYLTYLVFLTKKSLVNLHISENFRTFAYR